MVKEPGTPCWLVFSLDLWPIVALVFSLGGHMDTYRTVSSGRGAFELCLPSSGNHYQICLLRNCIRSRKQALTWSWGEDRRPPDRVTLNFVGV